MAEHAHSEMHWIARGVAKIAEFDADFVAEIYEKVFGFRETSDAKTSIGESQILSLSSNRRQDFEMSWYGLSESFPKFIAEHPEQGIRALALSVEGHLRRKDEITDETATFVYRGVEARITRDRSYSWRQFKHYQDALTLLPPFDAWLDSLAQKADPAAEFSAALLLLAEESSLAGIWASVIAAATRYPAQFGHPIVGLLAIPQILTPIETTHEIGRCLPAIYPFIATAERAAIERSILGLRGEMGTRSRSILLGTIPIDLFATSEARQARETLAAQNKLQVNRPPVEFTSSSRAYDSRAFLKDEGVDVESAEARRLLDLEDQLKAFTAEYLNATPNADDILKTWPAVEALWIEFTAQEMSGASRLVEHALAVVAEAAARIARADLSVPSLVALRARAVDILIRASRGTLPEYNQEIEDQFNSSISWGSPSSRIEAAQGIMSLLRRGPDHKLLDAAEHLLHDPVAAVRWHVAHMVFALIKTKPDFVWATATYIRDVEDNRGVIAGFLGEVLPRLVSVDRDRAIDYAEFILARFKDDTRPGADRCVEYVLSLLWDLYIWDNDARAAKTIFAHVEDVYDYAGQLHALIGRQRGTLNAGALDNPADNGHGARERAFSIFETVAQRSLDRVSLLLESHKGQPFGTWPEAEQEEARKRFGLLDLIARELFFASGAYHGHSYPDLSFAGAQPDPTPLLSTCDSAVHTAFESLGGASRPSSHRITGILYPRRS